MTAEEIRYMAAELEDTLGGVYSALSAEFQLPLIRIVMWLMERGGEMPSLPKDSVVPTIITGLDALGRNHEGARLEAFLGGAAALLGPGVASFINMGEFLRRRAVAFDIDQKNLILTDEQRAQASQAAAAQGMLQAAAPNIAKSIGDQMTQRQETNG